MLRYNFIIEPQKFDFPDFVEIETSIPKQGKYCQKFSHFLSKVQTTVQHKLLNNKLFGFFIPSWKYLSLKANDFAKTCNFGYLNSHLSHKGGAWETLFLLFF